MAINVPVLDTTQRLIELNSKIVQEMERSGVPSDYFEELWYALIKELESIDARLIAGGL
jgi:hypothetical protein